ncbi:hypothetical protein D3C80_1887250 [compost metagenome]
MPLLITGTDLGQQVESDLPVEEAWLQWTGIEQLGGLARQLTDRFLALGRHCQVGHDLNALDIQQTFERRQGHRQRNGGSAWAGDLRRQGQLGQLIAIGFRDQRQRLIETT